MKSSLLFSLVLLLLLQACTDTKERLVGDRSEILHPTHKLTKDLEADSIGVELEEPILNTEWSQSDYDASHKIPHLEVGSLKNVVWKKSIGQGHSSTGFLLCTPLIENDSIFTLDTAGRLKALDLKTGKELWQHRLEMKSRREDCSGGGIALGNGKVFAAFSSADVVALDAMNGTLLWQVTLPHSIRSAPTFYKGLIYLVTKNNRIICLKGSTGEKVWQQEGTENSCSLIGGGKPAIHRNTVIAPYSSGELYALRRENGFPLWTESLGALKMFSSTSFLSHIKASPVIDRDMVFAVSQSGRMIGADFRTGNIIWEQEIRGISTPIVHGSFVFVVTSDHQAVCLVRHSGKIVWVVQLPGYGEAKKEKISYTGPILAGHKLIITSSSGKAIFLNPQTGENMDQITLPGPCYLSPIIAHKTAYFLTESGTLVAFE